MRGWGDGYVPSIPPASSRSVMNNGVFFRSWTSSSVECGRTESMVGGSGGFEEASSFVDLVGMENGVSVESGRSVGSIEGGFESM